MQLTITLILTMQSPIPYNDWLKLKITETWGYGNKKSWHCKWKMLSLQYHIVTVLSPIQINIHFIKKKSQRYKALVVLRRSTPVEIQL